MIPFNIPYCTGKELHNIKLAIESKKICGNGYYTRLCQQFFENKFGFKKCLLTSSCTDALEMCAILANIKEGDEVIVPSYTFVSSALAFVRQGAKIVYADSESDNPNIDTSTIEKLITKKTKVIVPVHYAGVSCEMDTIMEIAGKYNLKVVEDAAQGVMSKYKGKSLGTIGDYGCYSFHETKNYSMGEGGAILIRDAKDSDRAEIVREKGTDRSRFLRGQVDKYTWVAAGSSYLPSDLNAAYLYAQLEVAQQVFDDRMNSWNKYNEAFKYLKDKGVIETPFVPEECEHNAHMYYIKLDNIEERTKFINYMKENDILTVFHYIPLHSAPAGREYGVFAGEDKYTTKESERIVRLPLYYNMGETVDEVISKVYKYFE